MTGPYRNTAVLTQEQAAVVSQPVDAAVLVTAGAGAGKTHTLVRRLERLLGDGEARAAEILVLTFSRSAVRELRRRLSQLAEAGDVVRVQTFDSWALDVLSEVESHRDWRTTPFDERIRAATAAIRDGLTDERHEDLRHVVIDEVQDLVGDRRELVQALLERFECGFTVVGDPAQSIYGFQVADPSRRGSEAGRFFERLRDTFRQDLVELTLTENFRARTSDARIALAFGPPLRDRLAPDDDAPARYEALRTALMGALVIGDLDDEFTLHALHSPGTTGAVLCRTNGQALVVSERLQEGGVPHRLQREAQDRVAPSWLSALFRAVEGLSLTRERFMHVLEDLEIAPDLDSAWRSLVRVAGASGRRVLDLRRLRDAIGAGRLPDELTAQQAADLVVSSFHRAKGLEFDRVVVVDPGPVRWDDADIAEEARLLYVAMTRSRDDLLRLDPLQTWDVRLHEWTGRWVRCGRQRWQRWGLEVRGGDVHGDEPAGTVAFAGDPIEIQRRLATSVLPGDPVVFERLHDGSFEDGLSPMYLVLHDDRPIGVVSEQFRAALFQLLKLGPGFVPTNFPRRIERLRIDAVETVAGGGAAGQLAGLGEHGVWLAPRVVGLGRFVYDRREEHDE